MTTIAPYPLQWPVGRPRRSAGERKSGRFTMVDRSVSHRRNIMISVAGALGRLQEELDRIGARLPVVSSNMETRLDGLPRSGQREPDDPGVAVYFQLNGRPVCMPCDRYNRVADNIAAIAAHIEATRSIERHGVASIAEMFEGFTALPAPADKRPWWEVLGVTAMASRNDIEAAHRTLIREHHPDAGGAAHKAAEINRARDEGLKERS